MMGGQNDASRVPRDILENVPNGLSRIGVKSRTGLIQKDDLRPSNQTIGQTKLPLIPTRQILGQLAHLCLECALDDGLVDVDLGQRCVFVFYAVVVEEMLLDGQVVVEHVVLET